MAKHSAWHHAIVTILITCTVLSKRLWKRLFWMQKCRICKNVDVISTTIQVVYCIIYSGCGRCANQQTSWRKIASDYHKITPRDLFSLYRKFKRLLCKFFIYSTNHMHRVHQVVLNYSFHFFGCRRKLKIPKDKVHTFFWSMWQLNIDNLFMKLIFCLWIFHT